MQFLIKILKIITTIFASIVSAPLFINAQSGLVKFAKPAERQIAGFDKVFCVNLDKTSRVCNGFFVDEKSANDARFFVERGGKRIGAWKTAAFLGDVSRFEVWRGDLDNDGQSEIVIVNHDGQSNGMGVNYWTIYILPSARKNSDEQLEPLQFSAEDFSVSGGFIKNIKTKRFEILVSNWESDWQPKGRKPGLYLIGRWFNYKNGALVFSEKPLVVRRYTRKFEKIRRADLEDGKIPYIWAKSPDAEIRKSDLMNVSAAEIITSGTIETAKSAPLEWNAANEETPETTENAPILTLKIKAEDGKMQTIEYSGDESDSKNSSFLLFGDGQTQRVFPRNYLPANVVERLAEKRVKLIHYNYRDQGGFNILWLP